MVAAAEKTPTADAAAQETDIYTVARGRTVVTDDGSKGQGEDVILNLAEAKRLMGLGFIVDPDAEPVQEANGPTFDRR
jgi:hypothetical protein